MTTEVGQVAQKKKKSFDISGSFTLGISVSGIEAFTKEEAIQKAFDANYSSGNSDWIIDLDPLPLCFVDHVSAVYDEDENLLEDEDCVDNHERHCNPFYKHMWDGWKK